MNEFTNLSCIFQRAREVHYSCLRSGIYRTIIDTHDATHGSHVDDNAGSL